MCGLCMRMIRCESSHQGLWEKGSKGKGSLWLEEGVPLQQVIAPRAHAGESVYLSGGYLASLMITYCEIVKRGVLGAMLPLHGRIAFIIVASYARVWRGFASTSSLEDLLE